jgi:hypothetical protein
MILPYKFKLPGQTYAVATFMQRSRNTGHTLPRLGVVQVATHTVTGPRKPEAIQQTFWHESTHAILYSMGHPLWKDEKFVTEFSKRLVQLINTAEFK